MATEAPATVVLKQDGVVIQSWRPGERIAELKFPRLPDAATSETPTRVRFELVRVADEHALFVVDYCPLPDGRWPTSEPSVELHRQIFA